MKVYWLPLLAVISLHGRVAAQGQSAFQNLGFESARLVPIPGDPNNLFYFSDAFPGWTGYAGPNQITAIAYNALTISPANISLVSKDGPLGGNVIAGNYSAVLQSGLGSFVSFVDTSIAQVGMVPADASYLLLRAGGFAGGGINFSVSFAGQNVPYSMIGSGANYGLYAADVSALAGHVGELRFTSETTPQVPVNNLFLDSISFSSVPEPHAIALGAMSTLLLFGFRLFRRRRPG